MKMSKWQRLLFFIEVFIFAVGGYESLIWFASPKEATHSVKIFGMIVGGIILGFVIIIMYFINESKTK